MCNRTCASTCNRINTPSVADIAYFVGIAVNLDILVQGSGLGPRFHGTARPKGGAKAREQSVALFAHHKLALAGLDQLGKGELQDFRGEDALFNRCFW